MHSVLNSIPELCLVCLSAGWNSGCLKNQEMSSPILRRLTAMGTAAAKQLPLHPGTARELLESPWEKGLLVLFHWGIARCPKWGPLTASGHSSSQSHVGQGKGTRYGGGGHWRYHPCHASPLPSSTLPGISATLMGGKCTSSRHTFGASRCAGQALEQQALTACVGCALQHICNLTTSGMVCSNCSGWRAQD